jgi:streptomycin 6-kinase
VSNERDRLADRARAWGVVIDETFETDTSVIGYGRRDALAVVVKVVKQHGDEWRSGEVLSAFAGHGVVRVYEHVGGAMLLERLQPGNSLVDLARQGRDDEATTNLAEVIGTMRTAPAAANVSGFSTVNDWAKGFERYGVTGENRLPADLVAHAQRVFLGLCGSQRQPRLLHGDLQHSNVLFDHRRGWVAIDPKGVVGELEYEMGAVFRNPVEIPDLFTDPATITKRLDRFATTLDVVTERVIAWAFAQAVLSAIWSIEDGNPIPAMDSSLRLAEAIRPMLVPSAGRA